MNMTYADNFYDNNVDKVFNICNESILNGGPPKFFDSEMLKLKDEELNRLWKIACDNGNIEHVKRDGGIDEQ